MERGLDSADLKSGRFACKEISLFLTRILEPFRLIVVRCDVVVVRNVQLQIELVCSVV